MLADGIRVKEAAKIRPLTVRVSNIRTSCVRDAEECVRDVVRRESTDDDDDDDDDCIENITIVPSCVSPTSRVAIVDFKFLPAFLSDLNGSKKPISVPQSADHDLTFDVEFLGLTQTYPTSEEPSAE